MRRRLAVLASHEGTTLQAVLDACGEPAFPWELVLVISNNAESGALRRAKAAGVPARHLSSRTHEAPEALDGAICDALCDARVDLVLLAGYMKKLGPVTLAAFRDRIINTHPALLPKFGGQGMYGLHVHRAVLTAGERVTGASVHVVDAAYDTGPVIGQVEVPVERDDTPESLAARVQARERELVVRVLAQIATTGSTACAKARSRGAP